MSYFIFLLNSTHQDESNKIWFTQLDTPNSINEFLKFVFKSVKTNKEKQSKTRNPLNAPGLCNTERLALGLHGQLGPTHQSSEAGPDFDRRELADGEVIAVRSPLTASS
jgi:hypothetical protein